MDNEKLSQILAAMESFDAAQINAALSEAEQTPELQARLEKRYGNLIRVLLEKPDATLADFTTAFGTKKHLGQILHDVFYPDANKMEFVYLSHDEAKDVVDIIGAIVGNHIAAQEYIDDCRKTDELSQIGKPLYAKIETMHAGINAEVDAYPAGWYGKICIHMMKSMIYGVAEFVIMKSWLKKANASKVLKEFNFFLAACATEDYTLTEFRNIMDQALDFSEVLWLFPKMPVVMYPADYEVTYPKCVLPYSRYISIIKFTELYAPDGSIDLQKIIDRDGMLEIDSADLDK